MRRLTGIGWAVAALLLAAGQGGARAEAERAPRTVEKPISKPAPGQAQGMQRAERTQTTADLQTAIQGEANAAYRYRLFAKRADEEGYPEVAKLFLAAAESESIHRRNHEEVVEKLGGKVAPITLEAVRVAGTRENLSIPIKGEKQEESTMYPAFVARARTVGAEAAVTSFEYALASERQHERLFEDALRTLGRNPARVYYVSSISGETYAVPPDSAAPAAQLPGERYLEIR